MSKLILSYLFKTNLATFRSAILDDNTDKICRILDIERDYLNKQIDGEGNTALILAIQHASPLTVRLLLEQGALPDQPNGITSQTPLSIIASNVYEDYHSSKAQRTLEMAKSLLDHGAYVDKPSLRIYKDEDDKEYSGKETPLITSVRKRNLPLAKFLIERKANVNSIERQSQTRAIHFAITNGDEAMYDLLENAGALCCAIVTNGHNTLLHWFCYRKENDEQINLLKKLLDKGCDINAQNWEQRTPLMIAAKYNMTKTCRILLQNRADIDKRDSNDNQAIDLSIPGSECSELLLQQRNLHSLSVQSNDKIIWRKRLDSTQRSGIELNVMNKDEINNQCISSKYINDEKRKSYLSFHSYIYPRQRRESEEIDKKYERIWDKFLVASPKQTLWKHLYKPRTHSLDTRDKSSM